MKKMGRFCSLCILFLWLVIIVNQSEVSAGVAGSKHDLTSRGSEKNVCAYCHVPHKAAGAKIWSNFGNTSQLTGGSSTAIGNLCYTCHDGTVTDIGLKTVFNTALQQHKITEGQDCNMCHSVHDNTNERFMKVAKTGGGGGTGTASPSYCETCHSGASMPAKAAELGDHITGTQHPYMFGNCKGCHTVHGAANYTPEKGTVKNPILRWDNVDSAMCTLCHEDHVQLTKGGMKHPANVTAAGQWGKLTCETCHDVHQPGVTGRSKILREDNIDSKYCTSCHQSEDGAKGPGIGRHSHPVNINFAVTPTDPSKAPAANTIDDNLRDGPDYPENSASMVCESCHSVHNFGVATPLLRVTSDRGALCINCHNDK